MCPRTKQSILMLVLVLGVPATALAADWLLSRHTWLGQTQAPKRAAEELYKLYQLREFCNQSSAVEMRFDFAIQKVRDTKIHWNIKMDRSGGDTTTPKQVTINFGPSKSAVLYDPDFALRESQSHLLLELRNRQSQILRDRNSRYFEKLSGDVAKYGAEDPWSTVEAKHDELAQIIKSGDFQACVTELDSVLPTKVKKGGRQ